MVYTFNRSLYWHEDEQINYKKEYEKMLQIDLGQGNAKNERMRMVFIPFM